MFDPVCRYCGLRIVSDPDLRTSKSAWSAPEAEDPLACDASGPGHAPVSKTEWKPRPSAPE